jgi:NodT family efflux transporter outer membrane factor (OMF) lipoprotein
VGPFETDFYNLGISAQYELDLFGRVSRSIEAQRGEYQAAEADLDAARVSVAAEVARAYAQVCANAAQATVAYETAKLQGQTLDLTRRLLEGGRGTRREVDQAAVLVEQANAQVPLYEAERRASLYALAVLTGDPPATELPAASACKRPPTTTRPIPVGDGAALLARRPDVRAAERRLAAQTARVGVATAALYPSITLLGSATTSGISPGDLFKSNSFGFSLGPLISFNFPFNGAARARVRQEEAGAEGALASFDGALLTALRETEQALARADGAIRREAALGAALRAADNAARISRLRVQDGADSFLQLLDAERSRADARAAFALAQAQRADAQVTLFQALGGGWEDAPAVSRTAVAGEPR